MTCDSPGRSQGGCRSALLEDENMSLNTLRQIARNGIRTEPAPSRAGRFQVGVALFLRVDAASCSGYEHEINRLRVYAGMPVAQEILYGKLTVVQCHQGNASNRGSIVATGIP